MTDVQFHFNMADKTAYACRLLRKAYAMGTAVGVLGPASLLGELDQALWNAPALDFTPHCSAAADVFMLQASPIVLATHSDRLPAHCTVLVNLGSLVPEGFERFARLIEIVSADPDDRSHGRRRWQHYKDRGYAIQSHDMAATHGAAA